MTSLLAGNYAQSTVAAAISSGATSITLASSAGFVVPGSYNVGIARIDDTGNPAWNQLSGPFEIVYFGTNAANVLGSLTRGVEGTTAHNFAAGATVTQVLTAGAVQGGTQAPFGAPGFLAGAMASGAPTSGTPFFPAGAMGADANGIPYFYNATLGQWVSPMIRSGYGVSMSGAASFLINLPNASFAGTQDHFLVVWRLYNSSAQFLNAQINSDAGANYDLNKLEITNSSTSVFGGPGNTFFQPGELDTSSTEVATGFIWLPFATTVGVNKAFYCWSTTPSLGTTWLVQGTWKNTTAAASSILIQPGAGAMTGTLDTYAF